MARPVVRAFGPLAVELDGQALGPTDFGGRKPKLILEILLLAEGRPVARDHLADLLWPEQRPRNVPATIDTYVSLLRRALGAARRLLVTEPEAYRLARDALVVDLDRFDHLAARAATRPSGAERRSALEEALALVRGEVLEDEPYADWAEETRAAYRRRVLDVRVNAALAALDAGEPDAALAHAERALDDDALDERAHRAAMLGAELAGRRPAALRAYERCRAALAEELGADPSAATEALHRSILRGEVRASPPAEPADPARAGGASSATAVRRGRALRVLLVEDTLSDAHLVRTALETGTVPIDVEAVGDGEAALARLRGDGRRPDLLLLDLGLPGRSGLDVLAELKGDRQLRRVPVLMLTSSAAQADVVRSYDLHANGYLTKPADPADFAEVVRAIEAFWPLTAGGDDPAP